MGATSVTGVGLGASGGLQKTDNHCSCQCGGSSEETEPTPRTKRGCVVKHSAQGKTIYRSGQSSRIRVC